MSLRACAGTAEVNSQCQQLTERDKRIMAKDECKIMESAKEIEKLTATIQELCISASELEAATDEAEQRHSDAGAELVTMNSQILHLGKTSRMMLQQENLQLTREGELRWYQAVEEEQRK